MLLRLHIENLALIEHAELELDPGLNVLTGETGAGKTMLAQAIGLIAGGQPAAEMVGVHGDESYVEAEFAVPEEFFADDSLEAVAALRPEGEETLIVARRLSRAGRSRALVWGRSCARADLQAIGERLLEISSQHEARRLARPGHALDLLDDYADLGPARRAMADAWSGPARVPGGARAAARGDARRRAAAGGAGGAGRGRSPRWRPSRVSATGCRRSGSGCATSTTSAPRPAMRSQLLNPDDGEGAQLLAGRAAELVGGVEEIEPRLAAMAGELRDVGERLQEAAIELRSYLDELEADPARLDWIEDRLAAFGELERRHGLSIDGVVELAADAQTALRQLDGDGGRLAELQAEVEAAERRAKAAAAKLSRARASALPRFTRDVEAELADLGMEDAKLEPALDIGRHGRAGDGRADAADRRQPRAARCAAVPDGVGRRAVADRAGHPRGCPQRRRPGNAAAGRGRCRGRRPHGECRRREAEGAGRAARSCSASRTCRRSPRRPTPTSASRSCRATRRRRASSASATRGRGRGRADARRRRGRRGRAPSRPGDRQGELTAASGS